MREIWNDVDAVLFDMDGVLIDSFRAWVAVLDECRRRRGLSALGVEGVRAVWGQGISEDAEKLFPGTTPQQLAAEYDRTFISQLEHVEVISEAPALVEGLHARGFSLAVVTNTPLELAGRLLERFPASALFGSLCAADEVPRGKPDPAIVRLALDRLGVRPERSLMIGDTELDVAAARAAGVRAIGFGVDGDVRVDDLSELAVSL